MKDKNHSSNVEWQEEWIIKTIESAVTLNPMVGMGADDLRDAVKAVIRQSVKQPRSIATATKSFATSLLHIAAGKEEFEPKRNDRRFNDIAWKEKTVYRKLQQCYLAWDASLDEFVDSLELNPSEKIRAQFVKEAISSSLAPTNFLLSNPKALRKCVESRGKSVCDGLQNFAHDVRHNKGLPSQVDKSRFTVGENIAGTAGAVVYKNDLLELIQYKPTTEKVYKIPLLIVPPQINKYYIYDLNDHKSFVKFCINEGFQTFIVSWKNPTKKNRDWGLEQYVNAVDEAATVMRSITRQSQYNLLGACAGGVTSTLLSYISNTANHSRVNSLSLSVCMLSLDLNVMDLGAFVSPSSVQAMRIKSKEKGVLEGEELARVFNWLRPNDLVWNYHVNNYLLGEKPPAFDILFWNSDSTNLTAKLHCDFLDLFEKNLLEKNEYTINGSVVNLKDLTCDKYITAGVTDHITPWKLCYKSTQILGGSSRFVLSSSGHIQSLINPPKNKNAWYYCNSDNVNPEDPDRWHEQAEKHVGSWWLDWSEWLSSRSGDKKNAPKSLGNKTYLPLGGAPGSYVYE